VNESYLNVGEVRLKRGDFIVVFDGLGLLFLDENGGVLILFLDEVGFADGHWRLWASSDVYK
jgi:hypothetical protein